MTRAIQIGGITFFTGCALFAIGVITGSWITIGIGITAALLGLLPWMVDQFDEVIED